jgi:hypothetical protein
MEGSGSNPDVATNRRSGTHKRVPLRSFLRVDKVSVRDSLLSNAIHCTDAIYRVRTVDSMAPMQNQRPARLNLVLSCTYALHLARDYGSSGLTFGTLSAPPASAIFGMISGTAESAIFSTSSMDETGIS